MSIPWGIDILSFNLYLVLFIFNYSYLITESDNPVSLFFIQLFYPSACLTCYRANHFIFGNGQHYKQTIKGVPELRGTALVCLSALDKKLA